MRSDPPPLPALETSPNTVIFVYLELTSKPDEVNDAPIADDVVRF
jgi:hypothetical protein